MTPRTAPLLALLALLALAPAAAAEYRYDRAGAYLDYAKRPSLMNGFAAGFAHYEIDDQEGVVEIWKDGSRYTASVHDAVYGLWHLSRYYETGRKAHLRRAEDAAGWLARKQDPETGIYWVGYPYDLDGAETDASYVELTPPWFGSNVQGLPISLLTRLYRETGDRAYLRQARKALEPLRATKAHGGVQTEFLDTGRTFFEGYATLPIRFHTLSHHVQTLVALHDMADLSPAAARLFERGMRTLHLALPLYDLPEQGRTATWLLHLTDPPRSVAVLNGFFQEFMVAELRALDSVHPDPVVRRYERRWDEQLAKICADAAEGCFFH